MKALRVETPFGRFLLREENGALCAVLPADEEMNGGEETPLLCAAREQLLAYLSGRREAFDLALHADGTVFEQAVWREVSSIPYGQTATYAQIAARIGKPGAARAVGRACGKNPLLIVVPCHRVIGSRAKLTGYAAGIELKRKLLQLENAI